MCDISKTLDDFFSLYYPSLSSLLRENRLERMKLLLSHFGNPEKNYKIIHVAGSKGKGTVSSFLSFFLNKKGFKTGLYLSPHVYDIRERFTLSSSFFSDREYLDALNTLKRGLENFYFPPSLGVEKPTTFELYTLYAYLLFSITGCEYSIIEVGLGGRLDATNTTTPIASVITQIELEHTKILGNTLVEISREKAGIIKDGVPVFILKQDSEILDVFKNEARKKNSPLYIYDYEKDKRDNTISYPFSSYDIRRLDCYYCLYILETMNIIKRGECFDLSNQELFSLPGRLERRSIEKRNIILDGAHTPQSISILKREIENDKNLKVLIFSSAIDKNWVEMGRILIPLFSSVIVTTIGEWKKCDIKAIYQDFISLNTGKRIVLIEDSATALSFALNNTNSGDTIVIAGSFYLLSEINKALEEDR